MVGCWAVGCSNRSEKGFSVYTFPTELARRQLWVQKVKRLDPQSNPRTKKLLQPSKSAKLCEVHFEPECFQTNEKTGQRLLNSSAVPTIFAHSKPQKPMLKRRKLSTPENKLEEQVNSTSDFVHPVQDPQPSTSVNTGSDEGEAEADSQEVIVLKRKLKQAQKDKKKAESELSNLQLSVRKLFNDDQLLAMRRRSTRGLNWKPETIKKALRMRFSCGTTGYTELIANGWPLPSVRTLQQKLQHINFEPGTLTSVFQYLKAKVDLMDQSDRLCCVCLDEMELSPAIEYDSSSQRVVGDVTIPGHSGLATHGLVVMIGGIKNRWKQVVAYHFTGSSTSGEALSVLLKTVIQAACQIGLRVTAVTSDMGSANQSMWKCLGIKSRRDCLSSFFNHPSQLPVIHCLADVPHLVKNLKSALITHKNFLLSPEICTKYGLDSPLVSVNHIKQLADFQQHRDLKLAPKLSSEILSNSGHFSKMNVGQALHVFSKSVSAGLRYLVEHEGYDKDLLTTAWFVDFVDSWFNLMASRYPVIALSKQKVTEYEKAIETLQAFITIMQSIQIGSKFVWKPVQTGIILSTTSVLNIASELLNNQLEFLLTGRLTQDCVENLFSTVRSKNPVPSPREFKYALKIITTAQYLKTVKGGSYQMDDREYLGELLPSVITPPTIECSEEINILVFSAVLTLSKAEEESLYYLAGYCVQSLLKLKQLCDKCTQHLAITPGTAHPRSNYLKLKNFKDGALFEVSSEVFDYFKQWELVIRSLESVIKSPFISRTLVDKCMLSVNSSSSMPDCHPVFPRLINKFVVLRLHIICKKLDNEKSKSISMGSKSVAMRQLVYKV